MYSKQYAEYSAKKNNGSSANYPLELVFYGSVNCWAT